MLPTSEIVADGYRMAGTPGARRGQLTTLALSERILFVEVEGYQCTAALGDESALLVDPLDPGRARQVVELLRDRYHREVSALVYTHAHADHISGAALVAQLSRHPTPLAIHAVEACAENVERRGKHAPPTVRHADGDEFTFEGIRLRLQVVGGHTPDSTMVQFPDDRVAQAVDLMHPGQAEFFDFGGAEDLWSMERALRTVASSDWRVLVAGHGQLGWPGDPELAIEYLTDLRSICENASREALTLPAGAPDVANARVAELRQRIREIARPMILADWADRLPGLEYTVDTHINRMADDVLYFG